MALNPSVQKKVQAEIDEVLGPKPPAIEDISQMNYTMATLMELQRLSAVAPASLPHKLLKETTVKGYKFKKGTVFLSNILKLLWDPNQFPDPMTFKPERFLDTDGDVVRKDYFVPFGIGKRICMGETLAKNEMFIFFVRLLQRLNISLTDKIPDPEDCISGITRIPKPYYVKVNDRT